MSENGKRKKIGIGIIICILLGAAAGAVFMNRKPEEVQGEGKQWRLVWADEFDGPDGSPPDSEKWSLETGGEGWGNNELQYYTDNPGNCCLKDGNLVIEAKEEQVGVNPYTSARMITKDKYEFQYGKVEMRAKLPYGQGIWPAFWMLGSDFYETGWPDCGEIDIMENVGKEPGIIHGTLHGPGYSGGMAIGMPYTVDGDITEEFHVYSIEWSENEINWLVDGVQYHTMNPDRTIGNEWVYNKEFFILLNLAVGGNWPGNPDETTVFPQKYCIDYVRVYQ